jgi:hypothetical protein
MVPTVMGTPSVTTPAVPPFPKIAASSSVFGHAMSPTPSNQFNSEVFHVPLPSVAPSPALASLSQVSAIA